MKYTLLVEDEPKVATVVREGLERAGYGVETARTAQEALDLAGAKYYDLIILDVMLPGMDGLELCRTLRQRGTREPLLMLTARSEVADRVAGLEAGADDYLTKPFALDELLARTRALIRKHEGHPGAPVCVADLCLDPASRQATRSFGPIDLSRKEFMLLELLARFQGRPVNRETIARVVWESESGTLSNIIDVFMNHLRKKVDPPGVPKLLHTQRGKGFVLAATPPETQD